ncbi:polysaccharide deacetylase family protein [Granulicella arctica]|uniref:hypothetical protein n=1 Tax=Granulicella arctica TaxID=940613 RepID=UPI0021E021D1|nr:hypothetical protein [Granulicella arctica]
MKSAFVDYYCCPEELIDLRPLNPATAEKHAGFFRFGTGLICYGRAGVPVCEKASDNLSDALQGMQFKDGHCLLPFNPSEVAANHRYERYVRDVDQNKLKSILHFMYYTVRPMLPVAVRRHLQKLWLERRQIEAFPSWPVDCTVDKMFATIMHSLLMASPERKIPFIWFWPEGKSSCAMMTHDVETSVGLDFVDELMNIDDSFGIKSSFQLIPDARYSVTQKRLEQIRSRGFEVNCHDLKHDGHLFEDHARFLIAAEVINSFTRDFQTQGFRSGALYRKQEWMSALEVSYDMSVPNVARFDPQAGGCCTVMPYFVDDILELPVTTIQDYTLFHVLEDYSMKIWDEQIQCIMQQNGLISFIVHPDYLKSRAARASYEALLARLDDLRAKANLWVALPGEVNKWWRERAAMKLVRRGNHWAIEGQGSEHACIAHAVLSSNRVCYEFESAVCS